MTGFGRKASGGGETGAPEGRRMDDRGDAS
jgi:hypothetical protein